MLCTHQGVANNDQLQSISLELGQHPRTAAVQLLSDREHTRQLVDDIREVVEGSDFDQVVQEALIKAGVAERIQQRGNSKLAQGAADEGTASSPKSTITFTRTDNDAAADQQGTMSTAGGNKHKAAVHINEGAHDMGLKNEVENLLQRTDSMLSRSSGRSSLHRSISATPLQSLNATAVSHHSGHTPAPLRGLSAGFDFDAASPALETPTMKSTTGSGLRESAAASGHGGRSLTGTMRRTAAGRLSSIGRRSGLNDSSNGFTRAAGQVPSPESDTPPIGAGVATFDGLSPSSGDGIGGFSYARRLSCQALSEIGDRFDGHAEGHSKEPVYESSASGDRTTVVLDKSASWKVAAAREAASPYTNFAPLEELVDAVTESVAAAPQGTLAGGSASTPGTGGRGASVHESAAGGVSASGRRPGAQGVLPHKQQVAHKVAVANMLTPEYVESVALARLKAELASVSTSGSTIKGHVNGGGRFDVLLLALTARLSQWSQLERKSEEMFHQMLSAVLDKVFAELLPQGEPSLRGPGELAGGKIGDSSTDGAVGSPTAGLSGMGGSRRPPGSGYAAGDGNRDQKPLQSTARRVTGDQSSETADDAAQSMRPSDSMLKAAFAKLALGQAMLRAGMPVRPNSAGEQPGTSAAAAAGVNPSSTQPPVKATAAAAGGDDTVAGTPDIGLSPALSRASSTLTARCSGAAPSQPFLPQQQQQQLNTISSPAAVPASASKRSSVAGRSRAVKPSPFAALTEPEVSFAGAATDPVLTLPAQQLNQPVGQQAQQQHMQLLPTAGVQERQWYSHASAAKVAIAAGQYVQRGQQQQAQPHQQGTKRLSGTWLGDLSGQWQDQQLQQQQMQPAARWLDGWSSTSPARTSQPTSPCVSPALDRLRQRQQQQAVPHHLGVCTVSTVTPGGVTQMIAPGWTCTGQAACCGSPQQPQMQGCSSSFQSPAGSRGTHVAAAAGQWSTPGSMCTHMQYDQPQQQPQLEMQQFQVQQRTQQQQLRRKTWQVPVFAAADAMDGAAAGLQQYTTQSPGHSVVLSASPAQRSPQPTVSRTLANMQQRYDQEQRSKISMMQQCQQQQQQQEPGVQSWLAADGSLSTDTSPVRQRLGSSSLSPVAASHSNGTFAYHTQDQSPRKQVQTRKHAATYCGAGSTAVRVCSPGAEPGSPIRQQVAIKGGCVNVYNDAVEVQSDTPLEIMVSSCSPVLPTDRSTTRL